MSAHPEAAAAVLRRPTREPVVAVVYTSAPSVLADIARAMELAGFRKHLPADAATILKPALA
ncbi:MAG: hypothetical protein RMK15_11425, partial [Chloroflexota bacterium]|nr:hypothetical protein [Chloroflexota bacterium]